MKAKIKLIVAMLLFSVCLSIVGCSAVEKKLDPVYDALLNGKDHDATKELSQEKKESVESNSELEEKLETESKTESETELLLNQSLSDEKATSLETKAIENGAESVSSTVAPAGIVTVAEPNSPITLNRLPDGKKILLTGDSRTVCLYCSEVYDETEYPKHIFYNIDENTFTGYTDESIVVAKGGEGCSWMRAVGMPNALTHLDEADAIVIWFGVNDLHVFADYINYVNGLAGQYDIPIYYMTIGPCNGKWAEKNNDVLAFNSALTQLLDPSVTVIDAYSYIQNGLDSGLFATMDGLHYDYATSRAIYDYMVDTVCESLMNH